MGDGCRTACNDNAQCVSYDWFQYNGKCFLQYETLCTARLAGHSQGKYCEKVAVGYSVPAYTRTERKQQRGYDIDHLELRKVTLEICKARCACASNNCKSFDFQRVRHDCWFSTHNVADGA